MTSAARPTSEPVTIAGPIGSLEGLIDEPVGVPVNRAMVICHPHPLYGGAMTNKVVHTLAKAINDLGGAAVRFNFRGVGASEGAYADGVGETQDALAALAYAQQRWASVPLLLGGFSFGGAVAIRAAAAASNVDALVTVAPAIRRIKVPTHTLPKCPWLIVQGDRDELVDAEDVQAWAGALSVTPQIVVMRGVEHFFHGRLNDLREAVSTWLRRILA